MPSIRDTLLCTYKYDALDRLVNQTLPNAPLSQRFYCKSRLACEIHGAVHFSIFQQDNYLLAQQQREGNAFNLTLLATDQQRSVLQLLKTNHGQYPIAYSPYGNCPSENGLLSLLGFNGERLDAVTGHYFLGNGYRAFNPVLMRFNSPDSWNPFGKGGLNTYAYCLGDPVNWIDSNGHSPVAALIHAFRKNSSTLMKRSIEKSVRKTIERPVTRVAFKRAVAEQVKKTNATFKEMLKIEKKAVDSEKINKLRLPADIKLAQERYLHHNAEGIPYKSGIPAPDGPIQGINKAGENILRTDFFDDAIGYFYHRSKEKIPKNNIRRNQEKAGEVISRRAQYIRDYAGETPVGQN